MHHGRIGHGGRLGGLGFEGWQLRYNGAGDAEGSDRNIKLGTRLDSNG